VKFREAEQRMQGVWGRGGTSTRTVTEEQLVLILRAATHDAAQAFDPFLKRGVLEYDALIALRNDVRLEHLPRERLAGGSSGGLAGGEKPLAGHSREADLAEGAFALDFRPFADTGVAKSVEAAVKFADLYDRLLLANATYQLLRGHSNC